MVWCGVSEPITLSLPTPVEVELGCDNINLIYFFFRECLRFVNRKNSNSGAKTFITTLLNRSDKGLSLHQKQNIFANSFPMLRYLTQLEVNGMNKSLVTFQTGDWEAGADRFGGQGASSKNPSFVCTIKSDELAKHGEKECPHNHQTVKCTIRSFESLSENYLNQIKSAKFSSIEEFKESVDVNECHEYERLFREGFQLKKQTYLNF